MGTKDSPGEFDCYSRAEPDEPMFVLLARDPLAPALVRIWAAWREHTRGKDAKTVEAERCADDMQAWKALHSR